MAGFSPTRSGATLFRVHGGARGFEPPTPGPKPQARPKMLVFAISKVATTKAFRAFYILFHLVQSAIKRLPSDPTKSYAPPYSCLAVVRVQPGLAEYHHAAVFT